MSQTIAVTLPVSTVYVSGVVNDKAYVFALSGSSEAGTEWKAEVDRDENDIYKVEITAVSSTGSSTTLVTTVYYGLQNLITDRSEYDYLHWRKLRDKGYAAMTETERVEWDTGTLKGAYNVSDLNRVGAALNYMLERLSEASYISPYAFNAKANWAATDMPKAADLTYYLDCVSQIREAFSVYAKTPPTPPNTGALNYIEANNIEQIIVDVFTLLNNMLSARYYCGDVFSGEI